MRIFDDLPTTSQLEELGFDFNTKFGIEFEFYSDETRYEVARLISSNAQVDCCDESYNHQTREHWKIVTDGSLSEGDGEYDSDEYNCDDCDQDESCNEDCSSNNDCPRYDCSNCRRSEESRNDDDEGCFEERDDDEVCEQYGYPIYECDDCNVSPHCDQNCSEHCSRGGSRGGCGNYGMELVSPPLRGYHGVQQVWKVLDALNDIGVSVGRDCGLHIHHDASDIRLPNFKRLAQLYLKYEPTIDLLMPPSRRINENCHCKSLRYHQGGQSNFSMQETWERIEAASCLDAVWCDRYIKLNFTSYAQHGTIEFRHHSGTTDFGKTLHWLIFTQRMVQAAMRTDQVIEMKETSTEEPIALADMARVLRLDPPLREYWDLRARWFAEADERRRIAEAEQAVLAAEYTRLREARERAARRERDICYDIDNAMPSPFRVSRTSILPSSVALAYAVEQLERRRADWTRAQDLIRAQRWQQYARDFVYGATPRGTSFDTSRLDETQPIRLHDLRVA